MFYRIKFDSVVSSVLSAAGYQTTEQKFAVWPAGLSRSLIIEGKRKGLNAETAACLGMASHYGNDSSLSNVERLTILAVLEAECHHNSRVDTTAYEQVAKNLDTSTVKGL